MSSEAGTAEAGEVADAESANVTKFANLRGKIHDNLIRAFVEDMKYEDMTPVQAATIEPGLQGKDL